MSSLIPCRTTSEALNRRKRKTQNQRSYLRIPLLRLLHRKIHQQTATTWTSKNKTPQRNSKLWTRRRNQRKRKASEYPPTRNLPSRRGPQLSRMCWLTATLTCRYKMNSGIRSKNFKTSSNAFKKERHSPWPTPFRRPMKERSSVPVHGVTGYTAWRS